MKHVTIKGFFTYVILVTLLILTVLSVAACATAHAPTKRPCPQDLVKESRASHGKTQACGQ